MPFAYEKFPDFVRGFCCFILFFLGIVFTSFIQASTLIGEGPSSSAIGMAEAVTADCINTRAMRYNNAGLGFIRNYEFEVSHVPWTFNSAYEHLNAVLPSSLGGLGLSVLFLHSYFDNYNFHYSNGQRLGLINNSDLFLTAGLGHILFKGISTGASLNYIHRSFLGRSADSIGMNAGFLYKGNLISRIFHIPRKQFGFDDEDFRIGFAVNDLSLMGEKYPATYSCGTAFLPIPYVKILFDAKYAHDTEFKGDLSVMTGLELNYSYKYSKAWIRSGYEFTKGKLDIGGGIQFSVGDLFYRIDYALGLIDPTVNIDDLGRAQWFSFSMGENPVLLKLVSTRNLPLPSDTYNIMDDLIVIKNSNTNVAEQVKQIIYKIKIDKFTTADEYIQSKGYHDGFKDMLREKLSQESNIILTNENADMILGGTLQREGELLQIHLQCQDGRSGLLLTENLYERPIAFKRDPVKDYKTLDMVLKKEGDNYIFIPRKKGVQVDKDFARVTEMAADAASWLSGNIARVFTSDYLILVNFSDVDVYVDGEFRGHIIADKRIKLTLSRGEHMISFIKANTPKEDIKLTVIPGHKEQLNVVLKEGIFYVDMDIHSAPEAVKVMLDRKEMGETPLALKKIKNGIHHLQYVDKSGRKWSEDVHLDRQGTYNIYTLNRYNDMFKEIDSDFWNVINLDKGMVVGTRDRKLELRSRTSDAEWKPSGLVSRSFKAGKITLETDFRAKGNNFYFIIGLIDKNGDGVGVSIDKRYIQYYETGRGAKKLVESLDLKDKGTDHHLKIVYQENGVTDIYIDDLNISEHVRKLGTDLRIAVVADSDRASESADIYIRNLAVKNEFR